MPRDCANASPLNPLASYASTTANRSPTCSSLRLSLRSLPPMATSLAFESHSLAAAFRLKMGSLDAYDALRRAAELARQLRGPAPGLRQFNHLLPDIGRVRGT